MPDWHEKEVLVFISKAFVCAFRGLHDEQPADILEETNCASTDAFKQQPEVIGKPIHARIRHRIQLNCRGTTWHQILFRGRLAPDSVELRVRPLQFDPHRRCKRSVPEQLLKTADASYYFGPPVE